MSASSLGPALPISETRSPASTATRARSTRSSAVYELGLSDLVSTNVRAGRLKFTIELAPAVSEANAVFIAVGTPSRRGDGHADLSFVYDAARALARALEGFTVVITKSTVPVGTGDEVRYNCRPGRGKPDQGFIFRYCGVWVSRFRGDYIAV
jgi:UDP-N-acetyl-D-mannosaminuronate dehydrogenase